MENNFYKTLWELGLDNPEAREAIARSISGSAQRGYSIPTRQYCEATGEVEDIHITAFTDLEGDKKDRLVKAIKKVDAMTVGQLAKILGYARAGLIVKEAEGKELTEPELTIRDIDITLLALVATIATPKVIKPELEAFETIEEFEEERARITGKK